MFFNAGILDLLESSKDEEVLNDEFDVETIQSWPSIMMKNYSKDVFHTFEDEYEEKKENFKLSRISCIFKVYDDIR